MAISNSTIETINLIRDLDYEYNIKFIFILLIIILSISFIIYAKRMKTETSRQELIQLFLFTFGGAGLFNIFLYPFILKRDFSLDFITNIIFQVYTIIVSILGMFILWYLAELVLSKWFGVSFSNDNKNEPRKERDYR